MKDSYLKIRKALGVSGILLSFSEVVIGFIFSRNNPSGWWYSISATFYSSSAPLFIGLLTATALFLITYPSYTKVDSYVNKIAGVSALFVVWFPCYLESVQGEVGLFQLQGQTSNVIHLIAALSFFALLAYNIAFLFTKGNSQTKEKESRNFLYRVCALVMVIALVISFGGKGLGILPPWIILVGESLALLAFGIAWLVKGEALKGLNDKK